MKKINSIKNYKISTNNFDFIVLTGSTVITSIFSFIYSVYARKYVVPSEYGIFVASNILLLYFNYLQLGTLNSLNRDYTQLLGAGKINEAKRLKSSTFVFIVSVYALAFIIITMFVLVYFKGDFLNYYAFGCLSNALISLFIAVDNYSTNIVRMEGHFNYSAFVGIIKTIVAIVSGIFFVQRYGYYGLYIMPFSASLMSIILNSRISIRGLRLKFNIEDNIDSIKTGFPLLINSLLWTMMMSVDKFVILILMTVENLGVYSIALLGFSTMVLIPQTISQVFYFKISKLYGETGSIPVLIDSTLEYSKLVSIISSLASVIVYFLLPIFIEIVMPEYMDGIVAAQVLIIGVSIYSTTILFGNIFTILKLNYQLIKNSVILFVFNVVLSSSLCLILGKNIENVAIGTSLSYAIYSLRLMYIVSKEFTTSLKRMVFTSWSPVIMTLVPGIILYSTIDSSVVSLIITVVFSLLAILIFYRKDIKKLFFNKGGYLT